LTGKLKEVSGKRNSALESRGVQLEDRTQASVENVPVLTATAFFGAICAQLKIPVSNAKPQYVRKVRRELSPDREGKQARLTGIRIVQSLVEELSEGFQQDSKRIESRPMLWRKVLTVCLKFREQEFLRIVIKNLVLNPRRYGLNEVIRLSLT